MAFDDQLRTVVADHHQGIAATALSDPVQFPCDPGSGDRVVDHRCQTFAAEVVYDTKDTEPASVNQGIREEVERPTAR